MSTAIVEVQSAVAEFDRVAAGIAVLKEEYAGVVYDVTTSKGMDAAKSARAAIREPRYEIEKVRKAAKDPLLKLGKELDSRAKEITAQILAIEEPIDQQIKNEEARKEAERQAKIAAEQKRVADLQDRVAYLRGNQMLSATSDPELIADHISDLEREIVDDSFQEFRQQAEDAKTAGLARLREIHAAALAHQAEQARILAEREELARLRVAAEKREAEERAELERLRAEQAERDRIERERIAEDERRFKAERDAETARQQEELRQQREAQEAEERRLAQERAVIAREQEEMRKAKEAEERQRAEAARIAAVQAPTLEQIVDVLAAHYRVPAEKASQWLADLGVRLAA